MIVCGESLSILSAMPSESVHCCITSPPYWGLRAYQGDSGMIGLEPTLEEHIERLAEVFRQVRRVLRSDGTLWLNYGDCYAGGNRGPGGSQKQSSNTGATDLGPSPLCGLKPKDLMMMPARVALALQADGWYLRSEIIWHKPNPMPESVTDRPTSAHEKLFLFAKSGSPTFWVHEDGRGSRTKPEPDYKWVHGATGSVMYRQPSDELGDVEHVAGYPNERIPASWATSDYYDDQDPRYGKRTTPKGWRRVNRWRGRDYFYDAEAVRTSLKDPSDTAEDRALRASWDHKAAPSLEKNGIRPRGHHRPHQGFDDQWDAMSKQEQQANGANLRNVWKIATAPYSGAHFATFPPALVEPCIKAGTSQKGVCSECGAPWVRRVERVSGHSKDCPSTEAAHYARGGTSPPVGTVGRSGGSRVDGTAKTLGWHPSCSCQQPNSDPCPTKPAIVLDPFGGAGTVQLVVQRLGRRALCIEISPEYAQMARDRCEQDLPVTRRSMPADYDPDAFQLEFAE